MIAIAETAPIADRAIAPGPSRVAAWITRLVAILRNLGPYLAIEILLPGGTLMALLLWVYRQRRRSVCHAGDVTACGAVR